MHPNKYHKPIILLAKIAFGLFAFWFVLQGVNIAELTAMFKLQQHSLLILAGFLLVIQVLFGALRWRAILLAISPDNTKQLSKIHVLKFYYISVFFNCCLPGTVGGDVVRVWLIKSEHTPLPLAISSVVIDRLLTLFALGVMCLITMPILSGYLASKDFLVSNPWLLTISAVVIAILSLWLLFNLQKISKKIPLLKSQHWLEHLSNSLHLLIRTPKLTIISMLHAIIAHASYCLCAYVLTLSLGNTLSIIDSLTLVPWVLLIAIIPVSIGGWGLREVAMVFMLGLAGVPQAVALTVSVQLGLLAIIISLPAGILWLVSRVKQPSVVVHQD